MSALVIEGWIDRDGKTVADPSRASIALCVRVESGLAWPVPVSNIPPELRHVGAVLHEKKSP